MVPGGLPMTDITQKVEKGIPPVRRRELEDYARYSGLKLTHQESAAWNKEADALLASAFRTNPTAAQLKTADIEAEQEREKWHRLEELAPKTALEILYTEQVRLRLQEEKTQRIADNAEQLTPAVEALALERQKQRKRSSPETAVFIHT
jgi:hypothetical protein